MGHQGARTQRGAQAQKKARQARHSVHSSNADTAPRTATKKWRANAGQSSRYSSVAREGRPHETCVKKHTHSRRSSCVLYYTGKTTNSWGSLIIYLFVEEVLLFNVGRHPLGCGLTVRHRLKDLTWKGMHVHTSRRTRRKHPTVLK